MGNSVLSFKNQGHSGAAQVVLEQKHWADVPKPKKMWRTTRRGGGELITGEKPGWGVGGMKKEKIWGG